MMDKEAERQKAEDAWLEVWKSATESLQSAKELYDKAQRDYDSRIDPALEAYRKRLREIEEASI